MEQFKQHLVQTFGVLMSENKIDKMSCMQNFSQWLQLYESEMQRALQQFSIEEVQPLFDVYLQNLINNFSDEELQIFIASLNCFEQGHVHAIRLLMPKTNIQTRSNQIFKVLWSDKLSNEKKLATIKCMIEDLSQEQMKILLGPYEKGSTLFHQVCSLTLLAGNQNHVASALKMNEFIVQVLEMLLAKIPKNIRVDFYMVNENNTMSVACMIFNSGYIPAIQLLLDLPSEHKVMLFQNEEKLGNRVLEKAYRDNKVEVITACLSDLNPQQVITVLTYSNDPTQSYLNYAKTKAAIQATFSNLNSQEQLEVLQSSIKCIHHYIRIRNSDMFVALIEGLSEEHKQALLSHEIENHTLFYHLMSASNGAIDFWKTILSNLSNRTILSLFNPAECAKLNSLGLSYLIPTMISVLDKSEYPALITKLDEILKLSIEDKAKLASSDVFFIYIELLVNTKTCHTYMNDPNSYLSMLGKCLKNLVVCVSIGKKQGIFMKFVEMMPPNFKIKMLDNALEAVKSIINYKEFDLLKLLFKDMPSELIYKLVQPSTFDSLVYKNNKSLIECILKLLNQQHRHLIMKKEGKKPDTVFSTAEIENDTALIKILLGALYPEYQLVINEARGAILSEKVGGDFLFSILEALDTEGHVSESRRNLEDSHNNLQKILYKCFFDDYAESMHALLVGQGCDAVNTLLKAPTNIRIKFLTAWLVFNNESFDPSKKDEPNVKKTCICLQQNKDAIRVELIRVAELLEPKNKAKALERLQKVEKPDTWLYSIYHDSYTWGVHTLFDKAWSRLNNEKPGPKNWKLLQNEITRLKNKP